MVVGSTIFGVFAMGLGVVQVLFRKRIVSFVNRTAPSRLRVPAEIRPTVEAFYALVGGIFIFAGVLIATAGLP
jgi:hypothetical protein